MRDILSLRDPAGRPDVRATLLTLTTEARRRGEVPDIGGIGVGSQLIPEFLKERRGRLRLGTNLRGSSLLRFR